ncbi:MAG: hypothetical protein NTY07_02260 [Bacteroidia bacterium]|jgi:hypothetical protein|nr:hypothetical protein [Bacteroidia bacterium]
MQGIKTGGRQKGTQNNISTVIKGQIEAILTSKFTTVQIEQDIATLDPKDRLMVFLRLLEYSIPKMRATDLTGDALNTVIRVGYGAESLTPKFDLSKLTDDELRLIIELQSKSQIIDT